MASQPRVQGGAARSPLPAAYDRPFTLGTHAPIKATPNPPEQAIPVGSDLVEGVSTGVEWRFLPSTPLPTADMASDASGSWGCGAWCDTQWFQLEWDRTSQSLSIMVKELLPVVLTAAVWGSSWSGRRIRCHCDNQAVVACLHSRTTKHPHCLHLLRVLAFVEARYRFHLQPLYINTKLNHLADDLSRNNLLSFLTKVPLADKYPVSLPPLLLSLLLDPEIDWTSPHWQHLFSDIFRTVLPQPHKNPTVQR